MPDPELATPPAAATPDTDPGGPPPPGWINRFARFAQAQPPLPVAGGGAVPRLGTALSAQPLPAPHWVATSDDCAALLGLPADWASRPDWRALEVLSGAALWPGMAPLASVYSGHQFGVWAGQLGDGRALLLGEYRAPGAPADVAFEIQLKGSGRTPYSRMGDGRAVLRSSIREFLGSEAMHALGVPTTRALAVVGSTLPVQRETVETGAVVTRVAPSFLRFGHFEHFAARGEPDMLRRLFEFTLDHGFRHLREGADGLDPLHAWLAEVIRRTAQLMAHWQALGFAHGVMNTDNMSVLGLTLDYGPFGFLDGFDPMHVCNHSDTQGRYAFVRQPRVAWWNLHALAHALRPLCDDPDRSLPPLLERFGDEFGSAYLRQMRARLGLEREAPDDLALCDDFCQLLTREHTDHTLAFRALAHFDRGHGGTPAEVRDQFIDRAAIDAWGVRYLRRLDSEPRTDAARQAAMQRVNPKYILRNHLAQAAIEQAQAGDFTEVQRLHRLLRQPFDEQPAFESYAGLPPDWARTIEISCSS